MKRMKELEAENAKLKRMYADLDRPDAMERGMGTRFHARCALRWTAVSNAQISWTKGNREGLAIEIGTSIPATRVIRALSQLVALYGRPNPRRLDNGPELTAQVLTEWCAQRGIGLR